MKKKGLFTALVSVFALLAPSAGVYAQSGDAYSINTAYLDSSASPSQYVVTVSAAAGAPDAVLIAKYYNKDGLLTTAKAKPITKDTGSVSFDYMESGSVRFYIWDSMEHMQPLARPVVAIEIEDNLTAEEVAKRYIAANGVTANNKVYKDPESLTIVIDSIVEEELTAEEVATQYIKTNGIKVKNKTYSNPELLVITLDGEAEEGVSAEAAAVQDIKENGITVNENVYSDPETVTIKF